MRDKTPVLIGILRYIYNTIYVSHAFHSNTALLNFFSWRIFIRVKHLLGRECVQLLLSLFQKHLPHPDLFRLSFMSLIRQLNFNVRMNLLTPLCTFCSHILQLWCLFFFGCFNRLTPNGPYMGRTAPLTSKRCILYIYSTNIGTEYFKHVLYSPFFSLQNAVCFIMLTCLVPVLFTFYIQGVLKLKKK